MVFDPYLYGLEGEMLPSGCLLLLLGFEIEEFDAVLEKLVEQGTKLIQAPYASEFGWMAVVEDLEGRKVELYKK
jgi:predicted enzyme related to lactoylglutathione lyase